jgi:glycerol-3-phosphate acyltransferase PlsY
VNLWGVVWLLCAFLVGSIPFGVLVARVFYRSDIRREGSGNIGAANALRSYGKTAGIAVLVLDALKGFFATWVTGPFGGIGPEAVAGFCAMLGHCYSPWLNFKGGKGVATWLGVLLALQPLAALSFAVVWLALVIPTRYASLGSLVATVVSGAVLWWLEPGGSVIIGCVAVAATALIFWKHRENIARLRAGTESKLVLRRSDPVEPRTLPG